MSTFLECYKNTEEISIPVSCFLGFSVLFYCRHAVLNTCLSNKWLFIGRIILYLETILKIHKIQNLRH